ncbi:hypothetical protein Cch01nite_13170 [Cellulomonas chitinilytica]|uniref:Transport permease protein n=1 Tax=Cellulomonas chitinilytica TaxID=398759 RepID=A0A919P2B3_9CELL|nr:ABC transporter permease [Cellulomonas chitinilytica]GIG20593.1 hypothetical protein Cch01nite_13170 [Cellulomonas chitinilytica]
MTQTPVADDQRSATRAAATVRYPALALTERNVVFFRSGGAYWWLALVGLAEATAYLLGMGWGVGSLVGPVTLPDGTSVPYAAFVAPALLATAAMDTALAESVVSFFGKLRFARIYVPILNTPLRPMDVAVGELVWTLARVLLFAVSFVAVMLTLGLVRPSAVPLVLPACLLVGLAFGAVGMVVATALRSWQDFDLVGAVQFTLFMFSGTFVPVSTYPGWLQWVVELSPLYHGIELVRPLALGTASAATLGHAAVLVAVAGVGFVLAARRMHRTMYS